jgi:hypothetical protein
MRFFNRFRKPDHLMGKSFDENIDIILKNPDSKQIVKAIYSIPIDDMDKVRILREKVNNYLRHHITLGSQNQKREYIRKSFRNDPFALLMKIDIFYGEYLNNLETVELTQEQEKQFEMNGIPIVNQTVEACNERVAKNAVMEYNTMRKSILNQLTSRGGSRKKRKKPKKTRKRVSYIRD